MLPPIVGVYDIDLAFVNWLKILYIFRIRLKSKEGIILCTLTTLLFIYTIFIWLVCYTNSNTPVILSSDITSTFVQLTSHMLLVMVLPFVIFRQPSKDLCFIRVVVCGIFLIIPIGISLSRVQKFLMVFNSDIRMDRRDIRVVRTKQTVADLR